MKGNTRLLRYSCKVFKLHVAAHLVVVQHVRLADGSDGGVHCRDGRMEQSGYFGGGHQSRHTAATTIFLSNGVPIETVSSMLGHKSIKTTQIYAKITKEKLNQDMENLAARLNGVEEFAGCTI